MNIKRRMLYWLGYNYSNAVALFYAQNMHLVKLVLIRWAVDPLERCSTPYAHTCTRQNKNLKFHFRCQQQSAEIWSERRTVFQKCHPSIHSLQGEKMKRTHLMFLSVHAIDDGPLVHSEFDVNVLYWHYRPHYVVVADQVFKAHRERHHHCDFA